jgi:hypothetical protein
MSQRHACYITHQRHPFYFINLITLRKSYKFWRSSVCNFSKKIQSASSSTTLHSGTLHTSQVESDSLNDCKNYGSSFIIRITRFAVNSTIQLIEVRTVATDKLTVAQLVTNFPAFLFEAGWFTAVTITASHMTLSTARLIHSTFQ